MFPTRATRAKVTFLLSSKSALLLAFDGAFGSLAELSSLHGTPLPRPFSSVEPFTSTNILQQVNEVAADFWMSWF